MEERGGWGTHTIPQWDPDLPLSERGPGNTFWTSGKPPLRKDEAFRARLKAKHARHLKNKADKAAKNADRASNAGRK